MPRTLVQPYPAPEPTRETVEQLADLVAAYHVRLTSHNLPDWAIEMCMREWFAAYLRFFAFIEVSSSASED